MKIAIAATATALVLALGGLAVVEKSNQVKSYGRVLSNVAQK